MRNQKMRALVEEWRALKDQENRLYEKRKQLEEKMIEMSGLSRELESSTEIYLDDDYNLIAKPNLSYKTDSKALDEKIKQDEEFAKIAELLFRKKYELNVVAYKMANSEIAEKILPYVSVSYIRPTFELKEVTK